MDYPDRYHGSDGRGQVVRVAPDKATLVHTIAVGVALILVPFILMAILSPGKLAVVVGVAAFPIASILGLVLSERSLSFDRAVRTRLALGVCPRCRYPIDNLLVEEDGCTICPECGAAWKVGGAIEMVERE